MRIFIIAVSFLVCFGISVSAGTGYLLESQRDIPVAYEVDVAVIGGTSYGVSAAVAAAKQGVSVFLAAPRPYLGEDICATHRLWLGADEKPTTGIGKRLFAKQNKESLLSLPFTYQASVESDAMHKDTQPLSLLADGKWRSAPAESVQYNKDVTIIAELAKTEYVKNIHLMAYQREKDFVVDHVVVSVSGDGISWQTLMRISNPTGGKDRYESSAVPFSTSVEKETRFVKFEVKIEAGSSRVLLGEIILEPETPTIELMEEYANPTTPFQVKYELDQALITAGVDYLYSAYVTDALVDEQGRLAGFIMANRAGRQAVLAKVLVDASPRATFARMAGVKFETYPSGSQTFKRIVVGGEPKTGLNVRKMPFPVTAEVNKDRTKFANYDAYEYTLEIPMKDGSFASFAEAEQSARDQTWQDGQVDQSEVLYHIPPDPLSTRTTSNTGTKTVTYATDLNRLGLFVLGPCAHGWGQQSSSQMMASAESMATAIANAATSRTRSNHVSVKSENEKAEHLGEVKEFLDGIRNVGSGKTIQSPDRPIPILGHYDVVVIGGGTGGAPAGIGAARKGAKTLVVEYLHGLGGMGTMGLIGSYYYGHREGFTKEIDDALKEMVDTRATRRGWNVENRMEWYRRELRKAGADIWFGCIGSGALLDGDKIKGAVVVTPQGRGIVLCDVLIDSTGNADIAAAAGAETIFQGPEHAAIQGTGLPPRMLDENYTNTDYTFIYDDDMLDLWRAFVVAKEKFKGAYDMGQIIDSRERRRIVGDYTISPLDILNQRRFADTISLGYSNFDTHGYTIHDYFSIHHPDKVGRTADTPYRALLPKGMDGIIVTGLGISAHRDAMPILRMQPCIQNQGYAMGVASWMASKENIGTRDIDVKALQKHLVDKGSLPARVLTDEDMSSYSDEQIRDAVQDVVNEYKGLSVILTEPEKSLPYLQQAYLALEREELKAVVKDRLSLDFQTLKPGDVEKAKVLYAQILGMMGDGTGSRTLIETVAKTEWDQGWAFTGMGQFGGSLSPLDGKIIALSRTQKQDGLHVILEKAQQLDKTSEFSHHRAIAVACETLKNPKAAPVLAALLQKPGMSGHAWIQISEATTQTPTGFSNDTSVRDRTLRELILARALFRCGDYQGIGKQILETYANDLRAHYSKHAKDVLEQQKQ
jgi:flavin-dependent dehydrogenase